MNLTIAQSVMTPDQRAFALSASRQAAGSIGGVAFDGATSGTRGMVPLTWSVGTGDFSAWVRFRCPSSVTTERGVIGLGPNATDAGGAGSFRVILQTSGTMSVRLGTVPETLDFAGFVAAFGGQWVDVVVTRGSAGWTVYVNGLAATPTSGSLTTAASINSSYLVLGVGLASTNIFNSTFHRAALFNYALAAADVASLVVAGVSQSDQWGSPSSVIGFNPAVLNGGFETNSLNAAGTWGKFEIGSPASTATIDTSGSFSKSGTNAGKFTLNANGDGVGFFANNGTTTIVANRRYRASAWFRRGASVSGVAARLREGSSGTILVTTSALTTTYQQFSAEWVATTNATLYIERSGGIPNGEIYVDDVELTRLGAIVDLDFTMGCGNQLQDMSPNGFNVNLFGGFTWCNPRDFGQLRVTISQLGNTVFPVGLPAEAMITGIAAAAAGAVTLSIGTAMGGTQVVNAASLSTGRNGPLTVASAFPGGTLWGNLSAAVATNITINFSLTT